MNKSSLNRKIFSHLTFTILAFGFSSGLPLALSSSTLQAWYTVSGVSIVTIGMLSLVGYPYTLKFLWSPLLDRFTPAFLSHRRGWILLAQLALIIFLLCIAVGNPNTHPTGLALLACMVALSSATQDIAIDAYRAEILSDKLEVLGWGASLNTLGYRIAMLVSGGLAMILADHIGWRLTYTIMAALMGLNTLVTYFSPPVPDDLVRPTSLKKAIIMPFKEFLTRKSAWGLLLLILLYQLTNEFSLSLLTPFLLRGLGFSLTDVGVIYKGLGFFATLFGTFVGGIWMVRFTLYRALLVFGILKGIATLAFLALAIVGKSYIFLTIAITIESFFGSLGSVAYIAFLMKLCDKHYTATQFALFTSLMAVGRVFIGPIAGVLVSYIGWVGFFSIAFFMAFPALILLMYLKNRAHIFQISHTNT